MNISIKTIPHDSQRYETIGDWNWLPSGDLEIFVSDMGNWKYELLVALHELVEVALCKDRNILQQVVEEFDIQFEKDRDAGVHGEEDEPGDDPAAPYRKEHFFASNLERLMVSELNVDINEYDKAAMSLSHKPKP